MATDNKKTKEIKETNNESLVPSTTNNKLAKADAKLMEKDLYRLSLNDKIEYARLLVSSRLLPESYTSPEQVLVTMDMATSLGVSLTDAIFNIDFIGSNKPGSTKVPAVRAKLLTALIFRRGGLVRTIRDWEPLYNGPVWNEEGEVIKTAQENELEKYQPIDYITTLRGSRIYNGVVIEEDASFTWSEAMNMELAGKSNWQKQPQNMAWARALSKLSRRFFSDYTNGLYESLEIKDVMGVDIDVIDIDDVR